MYLLADREFHGHNVLETSAGHGWVAVVRSQGRLQVELEEGWHGTLAELATPGTQAFYRKVWWTGWGWGMFRDVKGQGFHLDQTRLEAPQRLDRLMLVLALIYWWLLDLGIWVDRARKPKCSLFMRGLRWLKRMLRLDTIPDVRLVPVL